MTINDPEAFVAGLWDWGFLDDCFGDTKIRVTDGDGIVERRGKFLFFECKSDGVDVPRGQAIMFSQMAKKGFYVLVIWGPPNCANKVQVWQPYSAAPTPIQPATNESVRQFVRKWFEWANGG